jgi:hypothetical protein
MNAPSSHWLQAVILEADVQLLEPHYDYGPNVVTSHSSRTPQSVAEPAPPAFAAAGDFLCPPSVIGFGLEGPEVKLPCEV